MLRLKPRVVVIETDSHPTPPPYTDLPVRTSDDIFLLKCDPPKSLLVIVSGFIGTEMAAFFAGVGVKTSLFASGAKLLGCADGDIERIFATEFTKEVDTHMGASLIDLAYDGKEFTVTFEIDGKKEIFRAERVLFAIGRKPNTGLFFSEELYCQSS